MDHMIDLEIGYEVIHAANEQNIILELKIR